LNKKVPPVRIQGVRRSSAYPKIKKLTVEVPNMNCKQNERILQVSDETIIVGIDVASEIHYARAFDNRGIEKQSLK